VPSFENLVIVVAVAFVVPGLFPRVRLPSVVLEIVAGIVIGPSVLGLVEVDESVEVIAVIGLAFVLFLAGLEIEFEKLRGQVLRLIGLGFALSSGRCASATISSGCRKPPRRSAYAAHSCCSSRSPQSPSNWTWRSSSARSSPAPSSRSSTATR
jgi:hypothetical protein